MMVFRPARVVFLLLGPLVLSATARAQDMAHPALNRLSEAQVEAFAALVGEEASAVEQRILWDPGLTPFIAAAADARIERRRLGKGLTIVGFSLMGVGIVAGFAMVISGIIPENSCPYEGGSNCELRNNDGEVHDGFITMAAAVVVGLAMGIPGIVELSRTTDVEAAAVERYQQRQEWLRPSRPPIYPRDLRGSLPGRSVNLSLVSFSF